MIQYMKIGGYNAPAPRSYKCSFNDLDSELTTRNENGVMLDRDRLRADMFQVSASFRLKIEELAGLAEAIYPKEIDVELFDLTTAQYVTKRMYAASKTAELVSPDPDVPLGSWVDYSFNLIEC